MRRDLLSSNKNILIERTMIGTIMGWNNNSRKWENMMTFRYSNSRSSWVSSTYKLITWISWVHFIGNLISTHRLTQRLTFNHVKTKARPLSWTETLISLIRQSVLRSKLVKKTEKRSWNSLISKWFLFRMES